MKDFSNRMKSRIVDKNEKLFIKIKVNFIQEDEFIVAYCPELDLSTYARSIEMAEKAFNEALEIFIKDVDEKGTLEKVLLKLGWRLQQVPEFNYVPPKIIKQEPGTSHPLKTIIERIPLSSEHVRAV